jgi:hypothetical protein
MWVESEKRDEKRALKKGLEWKHEIREEKNIKIWRFKRNFKKRVGKRFLW